MKKLTVILSTLLIVCILYIAYGFIMPDSLIAQPKIKMEFNIAHLTDSDYKEVGTSELTDPTKDDFRKVEFSLKISHSRRITYRNIVIPDLKKIINSYDIKRYWYGKSSSQDNANERFATYTDSFVFYSKGLTKQQMKDMFRSASAEISWAVKYNKKELNLGDYINFQ